MRRGLSVGLCLIYFTALSRADTIQNITSSPWPARVFSPYVDLTLYPTPRIDQISQATGVKYFNLAFLVADASVLTDKLARWGGYDTLPVTSTSATNESWDFDYNLINSINNVRIAGGDVIVSFGGANGTPIDARITDVPTLTAEYQRVINTYRLRAIDLDIEGSWLQDSASIARRSAAIKSIQTANPSLKVWFTLPVLPTGLTADGITVLTSALNAGARIDGVNIMAMDYGDGAAPNPAGKMGDYAIQAATTTQAQLKSLLASKGINLTDAQVWNLIGVTPMIGVNDLTNEVFDLTEAQELLTFAQQKNLGQLSFWSATRDHAGSGGAVATNSGIAQTDYAFSSLYAPYTQVPEPTGMIVLTVSALLLRRSPR